MAKPGTKAYKEETVQVFYGINPKTNRVESVSLSRGGVLTKYGEDAMMTRHPIMPGRKAETEIVVVFGLTDVFGVAANMTDSAWAIEQRSKLEEKVRRAKETDEGAC